jgi:hypothetical protein
LNTLHGHGRFSELLGGPFDPILAKKLDWMRGALGSIPARQLIRWAVSFAAPTDSLGMAGIERQLDHRSARPAVDSRLGQDWRVDRQKYDEREDPGHARGDEPGAVVPRRQPRHEHARQSCQRDGDER